jgi:hypothetical protein
MSMSAIVDPTRSLGSFYSISIFPSKLAQHDCVFTVAAEMQVNT